MKTIFDKTTRDALIARINSLDENSTAQWGTMNVYQMLKHCVIAEEMYLGKTIHKRMFLGRLLGQSILKKMLKDETPMSRNAQTAAAFKVSQTTGDIAAEKKEWIGLIEEYANYQPPYLVHWFFGKMTPEQVGQFVYKHTDHHLRQFGA
jgi:hypothetical protein